MNKTLLIIFLLVVQHYCTQSQGQSQSQGQGQNFNANTPSKNSVPPATTTTPPQSNNSTNSISNTATTAPITPATTTKPAAATNSSTSGNSANSATTATSSTSSTATTGSGASSTSSNSAINQVPVSQTALNNSSQNKTPWFATKLLNLHNVEKALINQANYNYTWSDSLYKSAQSWADYLASSYNFYHSGTAGVGENIATATIRNTDMVTMMFGFWSAEKKYFMPWKRFPDCSTTGNWGDVAHYTQIVWGMSTEVGCGLGINTNNNVLVCQYSLPGNYIGNYVYLNATSSN